MLRIRSVKPEFFKHEGLFELEQEFREIPGGLIRLAFEGLWISSDREGRFVWRPRTLKLDILPYDEVDFSRVLHALATRGFIVPYEISGVLYGFIPTFTAHQIINNREMASRLPEPTVFAIDAAHTQLALPFCFQLFPNSANHTLATREPRVNDATATPLVHALGEGKGAEQSRTVVCTRHDAVPTVPPIIEIPLNTGKPYGVTPSQVELWAQTYPNVDALGELRRMVAWLDANPKKRKTRTGVLRFIVNWLASEQDRGGGGRSRSVPAHSPTGGTTKSATDIIAERRNARAMAAGVNA